MQIFKRVFVSVFSFVLILAVLSFSMISPMINYNDSYANYDAKLRKETAGQHDFIFIGDSDGMFAFYPSLFNKKTGRNSYNFSATDITLGTEYYIINKEIKRNPDVKNVVLQISYETFTKDPEVSKGEGDSMTIQRLDSFAERIEFLIKHVRVDDWLNIYSRLMASSVSFWQGVVEKRGFPEQSEAKNRWEGVEAIDQTISVEAVEGLFNSQTINLDFRDDHKKEISRIIDLCNENSIDLMVVMVPVSNSLIWRLDNLDSFEKKAKQFFDEKNVEFYDFNLQKNRYSNVLDDKSFTDDWHASSFGAENFTNLFAEFYISHEKNQDVSCFFEGNYNTLKTKSPYNIKK